MKTNFLYKNAASAIVIFLAITVAFITTAMADRNVLLDKTGYRFVSVVDPCHASKLCSTDADMICKYGTAQLWGRLNESDHQCVEVLWERQ